MTTSTHLIKTVLFALQGFSYISYWEIILGMSIGVICDSLLGTHIRNAIASTDAGEIKVTLFENGFSVKDTGVGIEPGEVELINKSGHLTPNHSGFGLGLYLVKSICKAYGLKCEVQSTVGKGAEFLVYFPEKVLVQKPASE